MIFRRLIQAALALLIPFALYTSGLTMGAPRPEYSPSIAQRAWLNSANVFHPDEFAYVGIAYRMLLRGEWDPNYYHNPPLNIYTNMGWFWASGAAEMPHDAALGDREIAPFALYVMARALSALYALLTVALTYTAGRIAFGSRAGMLAAAMVALSPLTVQHAHYATPNAQTTLIATAALLAGIMIVKDAARGVPRGVLYAVGGLLVGLTMAARYNAVMVGVVTGLALLTAGWRSRRWRPVVVGIVLMPAGFALGTPGIVIEPDEVIDQIRQILDWYSTWGGGSGFTAQKGLESYAYHLRYFALVVIGPVAVLAALGGIALALRARRRRWQDAWIAGVFVLYMVSYGAIALRGTRLQANLLFPLIAPCALLAGYAVTHLADRFRRAQWVGVILSVAVLAWPAHLSWTLAGRLAAPDTRIDAQAWIYAHVPRGTPVYLLGPYNVPLDPLDYPTRQTYKDEATVEGVRNAPEPVIVVSDAAPFVTLRDPSLSDPAQVATVRGIQQVLDEEWSVLARFERVPWPADHLPPDDVSYWHQVEIVIYCRPAACPVAPES